LNQTTTALALRPRFAGVDLLVVALALAAGLAAMRVIGTLGPANLRAMLPLGFVLMATLPWSLLAPEGRKQIGLRRAGVLPCLTGVACGVAAASICFALGWLLFGTSADNWYVSIAAAYRKVMNTAGFDLLKLHLIFTIPACLFSPLGEEIFFRGFLQRALESRFSSRQSTHAEAALFGIVHLCHHGLFVSAAGLQVRWASGALWVVLMFGTAWMFAWLRQRSNSLWPAVASHVAFNLTMNVAIFAALWQFQ
jgi:hypothetical protein